MKSLRRYLQSSLAATLLLLLAVLGIGIGWLGERVVHDLVATRLQEDTETLLSYIDRDPQGRVLFDPAHLSPLYRRPFSGHYYLFTVDDREFRADSLWERRFALQGAAEGGEARFYETGGPIRQALLVRAADYIKGGVRIRIWLAEDMTPHYAPLRGFYWVYLFVVVAAVWVLWWLQRRVLDSGLRSLETTTAAVAQLRSGELLQLSEQVPMEIKPLVSAVNRLSVQLQQRSERTQHALGNLAHALKTPLTLLQQLSEQPWWQDHLQQQAQLRQQLEVMRQRVEEELRRARIVGSSRPALAFNPARHLPDLVETLRRVHRERRVAVRLDCVDHAFGHLHRDDMLELFGNLLDNAFKWARGQVVVVVAGEAAAMRVRVEDDGPGAGSEPQRLLARGLRLDERAEGHGLGLSICADIVSLYGGRIQLDSSPLGGLAVEVYLPAAGAGVGAWS